MNMHCRRFLILLFALALGTPDRALARFYIPQLEQVPVSRLINNLERQVREQPGRYGPQLNLARAHAMAYALDNDRAHVTVTKGAMSLYEGHLFPWEYRAQFWEKSAPQSLDARARAHLARAIKLYAAILQSSAVETPGLALARLGHGWCSEQAGDKQTAIEDYRTLLKDVTLDEWHNTEFEAAEYLVALLDPGRDAAEIALLGNMRGLYRQRLGSIPPFQTPIAIPLDRATPLAEIEDKSARVGFDVDPHHAGQHWSWITPKAGWLAYNPKKTGKVVSGIRLFGNVSYWMFWDNGYQAMSALDDNGDGVLSGKELDGLVVWVDANGNGVCDPRELKSLAELNIKALSYSHLLMPGHPDHIVYAPTGVHYNNGTTGPSYDLILQSKP